MNKKRSVIIAGGDFSDRQFYRRLVNRDDYIIAVNGGTAYAFAIGLQPDLVIGDLDSLQPADRVRLKSEKTAVIEHPAEKDKSDLELALDKAIDKDCSEILIIGALGGKRVDHSIANLLMLARPREKGITARIIDEHHEIVLLDKEALIEGTPGDYLSLFALSPEAGGVSTAGLKYPLANENLYFASTRGLSNEFIASTARITLEHGLLLVIKTSRSIT